MSMMSANRGAGWSRLLAVVLGLAAGCSPSSDGGRGGARGMLPAPAMAASPAASSAAATEAAHGAAAPAATPVHLAGERERARYPWLRPDAQVRALEVSIAPPPGYARVALAGNDFGAWLRTLPLRAAGSPVRSYRGAELLAPGDARLAA